MSGATPKAEIARMIAVAEQSGAGFTVPILQAIMRCELNACWPMRDTAAPPLYRLAKKGRPVIVVLGDDDYREAGPAGWACAARVRDWAAAVLVHGTGGQAEHYAMAVGMTMYARRMLLIETTSAAAQDWAKFLSVRGPGLPIIGLLPPAPGSHPVMPDKGGLH